MVFKMTCIFSMSTIDCKFVILEILCLLETGPKLYSIIIRNNNVCTSSAHGVSANKTGGRSKHCISFY